MEKVTLQDLRLYDEEPIEYVMVFRNKYGDLVNFLNLKTICYPNVHNLYFGFDKPATYGEFMYQVIQADQRQENFSHCFKKIGKSYWAYERGNANIYRLAHKPNAFRG